MDAPERRAHEPSNVPANRLQRRKMRTRAALIRAAQGFIAEGRVGVPVLEITQAADVGMGSFYNHFDSKEELFAAAVTDVLDNLGALLDGLTASISDPAEAFAANFRLSGRLFRHRPQEAALLLANGSSLILSDRGLSPRALRDITAAIGQGRFTISDPELGLAIAGGTFFGLGTLLRERPKRDAAATVDEATENLLRILGMAPAEAHDLCQRPLPDVSSLRDSPADWPTPMASDPTAAQPD
jgi:AcrR family transcriptional regulator